MTSNSESSTINKDQKQEEPEISSKPNSDFPNGFRISGSSETERDEEETESMASSGSSNLKNLSILGVIEVAENEDGFKTPTSLEYMIPPARECPPAPKKQRPGDSRRRRASPPPLARRGLLIDCSDEFDSIFNRPSQEDQGPEIKRSRRAKSV